MAYRSALVLGVCLSFFSVACHRNSSSCLDTSTQKYHEMCSCLQFREAMKSTFPQDDQFYLTYDEKTVSPPLDPKPLPYNLLTASVHFPQLSSNEEWFLYCPNTGCPEVVECFQPVGSNVSSNSELSQLLKLFKKNGISIAPEIYVNLYAIPGFTSDWYLIRLKPFKVLHTEFTYQPIEASDAAGHSLRLSKRDAGGNLLEVSLSGFDPKSPLRVVSISEGERVEYVIETGTDGSFSGRLSPLVVGHSKGHDHVQILGEGVDLSVGCDWDMSTLNIKRKTSPTNIWKLLVSKK